MRLDRDNGRVNHNQLFQLTSRGQQVVHVTEKTKTETLSVGIGLSTWSVLSRCDGMGLVEAVLVHQQDLQATICVNGDPGAGEHDIDLVLVATEGLVLPGQEVEAASARGLVRVVAQLTTLAQLGAAAEALAHLEPLVALAGEGVEGALGRDGVGEELVGSSVIAQVSIGFIVTAVG